MPPDDQLPLSEAGLCETCRHSKIVRSDRGSVFHRCLLANEKPEFSKYPRLPVLQCAGWSQKP